MLLKDKINNSLLVFLMISMPFILTFKDGPLKYLTFQNLTIGLFLYYMIFCFATNKKFITGRLGVIIKCFIFLFFVEVFSGIFAFDLDLALKKLLTEFEFLIALLLINSLIIDESSYRYIFLGLLAGFLLACAVGILQYLGFKQFNIFSKEELNANAGTFSENTVSVTRIWGSFGNSLLFSEYLAIAGTMLYGYYRMIKKKPLMAIAILCLTFFCIFITVSRTSIFATAFAFLIVEFLAAKASSSKGVITLIVVAAVGVVAVLLLARGIQDNGNPLVGRFTNASQDLKQGRLNLWIKGFHAFSKNVFFGVGPGNLAIALSSEGFPMTSDLIAQFDGQHVENYYLTILYTYGIFGFYFFITICFYLLKYSYRLFKQFTRRAELGPTFFGGALFGSVIVFLIVNITIPSLISDPRIRMLFIFMVVIINNSFLSFDRIVFFNSRTFLGRFSKRKKTIRENAQPS